MRRSETLCTEGHPLDASLSRVRAVFTDPKNAWCAGLAPVLQLAERSGLQDLLSEHVRIDRPRGGYARLKVPALVAGMIAGANNSDDMVLLRQGALVVQAKRRGRSG